MERTRIRPARPDDEEAIGGFLAGLSLSTQTFRFFTGAALPAHMVRELIAVDERRDAVVATTETGEIVGHAMSYRGGRGADVEIAVVVTDAWQGLGLGPRLITALLLRASVRGAKTVGMDVMGENRRMLRLISRMWPDAKMTVSSGTVEVTAKIGRLAYLRNNVLVAHH